MTVTVAIGVLFLFRKLLNGGEGTLELTYSTIAAIFEILLGVQLLYTGILFRIYENGDDIW